MSYLADVPLILQGAGTREQLSPEQQALVQSYKAQAAGTSDSKLPILLIVGGLLAFLLMSKGRGGMTV